MFPIAISIVSPSFRKWAVLVVIVPVIMSVVEFTPETIAEVPDPEILDTLAETPLPPVPVSSNMSLSLTL